MYYILSKQSKLYFYNFTQSTRPALLVHVFHPYTVTMVGVHTQPEVSHNRVSVYTNTLSQKLMLQITCLVSDSFFLLFTSLTGDDLNMGISVT